MSNLLASFKPDDKVTTWNYLLRIDLIGWFEFGMWLPDGVPYYRLFLRCTGKGAVGFTTKTFEGPDPERLIGQAAAHRMRSFCDGVELGEAWTNRLLTKGSGPLVMGTL